MKFNYTVSILSKTIDRLNGQIAVQGAKETELLADELFIREDIENMQRQIRELQSAIIKLETDNQ
jgi:50S ribosomal subunit-associated GTPase HflX